jgi:hypothetical protein
VDALVFCEHLWVANAQAAIITRMEKAFQERKVASKFFPANLFLTTGKKQRKL